MSMISVTAANNVGKKTVIVSDETTPRQVLEDNNIIYSRNVIHLNGSPLSQEELDTSFAKLGVSTSCTISAIVKADNAAGIAIVGESVVITSNLKLSDYKMIAKYRPSKLVLKGGDDGKEVVFAVGVTSNPKGSINKVGAEFGSEAHDGTGRATITFDLPQTDGDVKDAVAEYIGSSILDLNKIEAILFSVIEEISAERTAVMESITVQ